MSCPLFRNGHGSIAFIVTTSAINIIGLKFASKLNVVLLFLQLLVMVAFAVLCAHYTLGDPTKPLFTLSPFGSNGANFPMVMAGAGIACYSYLGFDAVSTLTEETKDPQRTVPRAILLVTLIGEAIFVSTSYIVQVSHPSTTFADPDSAANEIARNIGGDLFVMVFLIGMVVGQFCSGIGAQASASRLLFALGRDSVFPKRVFGYLSPRFQTPVFAILLTALLALQMEITTSTSFINFGAFLTFTLVNLSVVFHYRIKERRSGLINNLLYVLLLVFGIVATVALTFSLDRNAIILGLCWLAVGIVYLGYLTKMFRVPPPETASFKRRALAHGLLIHLKEHLTIAPLPLAHILEHHKAPAAQRTVDFAKSREHSFYHKVLFGPAAVMCRNLDERSRGR